ncbi:MAG: methionyl-tRNA formyltransferase [Planctomycetota bacterium]|jgi:methionyl-tRNA formyltransferase
MRVLFCGSGRFAVPSLKAVLGGRHEVVGIITQPARPAGRGGKLRATPVSQAARAAGLEASECESINAEDSLAAIRGLGPDVMVVVDFGQFIRAPARDVARIGAFNLHGSLLPELRGAAPISWAIIRGYKRTGATTLAMVDQMDAGPIYLQAETEIDPNETAEELRERVSQLGAELVSKTLEDFAAGRIEARPQDESVATSAPILKKSDGLIDWSADAVTIRNLIHGTWSWPGGQAVFRRKAGKEVPVTIARAAVVDEPPRAEPGRVERDLRLSTGSAKLQVVEIKPAGKRLMTWRDFVNGYRVSEGDHFARPEV